MGGSLCRRWCGRPHEEGDALDALAHAERAADLLEAIDKEQRESLRAFYATFLQSSTDKDLWGVARGLVDLDLEGLGKGRPPLREAAARVLLAHRKWRPDVRGDPTHDAGHCHLAATLVRVFPEEDAAFAVFASLLQNVPGGARNVSAPDQLVHFQKMQAQQARQALAGECSALFSGLEVAGLDVALLLPKWLSSLFADSSLPLPALLRMWGFVLARDDGGERPDDGAALLRMALALIERAADALIVEEDVAGMLKALSKLESRVGADDVDEMLIGEWPAERLAKYLPREEPRAAPSSRPPRLLWSSQCLAFMHLFACSGSSASPDAPKKAPSGGPIFVCGPLSCLYGIVGSSRKERPHRHVHWSPSTVGREEAQADFPPVAVLRQRERELEKQHGRLTAWLLGRTLGEAKWSPASGARCV